MEKNSARKFLIATHGHLARGVKSSLDIIIGPTENLFLIEAYVEQNKGIETELKTLIENISANEELIIFTDLLGGSITNQVLQATKGLNVHVISGFNLGLLIEVIMADIETPAKQVIEEAITNAKEQMVYVSKLMTLINNDQTNEN